MARKKTKHTYWFDETDEAIDEYNSTTDEREKSRIYEEKLYYPIFRLCEYMVNTKPTNYIQMGREEAIHWLMSEVTFKLKDVDGSNNPFAYLHLASNHLLMNENMKGYEKYKSHSTIDSETDFVMNIVSDNKTDTIIFNEWTDLFSQLVDEIHKNKHLLNLTRSESKTLEVLLKVMSDPNEWQLEHFSKDLTNRLKEETGLSSQLTRPILNTLRPIIRKMTSNYFDSGSVRKPQSIEWTKRPASTRVPKELKDDKLYEEVYREVLKYPTKKVYKKYGLKYHTSSSSAVQYGYHYREEVKWE